MESLEKKLVLVQVCGVPGESVCSASVVAAGGSVMPAQRRATDAGQRLGYDWEVVASIGMLVFLLTFVACLLGYQLFLAATAQTTREHSCSGQVAYLAHVPAHVHPFCRGIVGNLWDFAFENADRDWGLPSIEEMVMREHARSEEHCC